jgi:hypothetical protein
LPIVCSRDTTTPAEISAGVADSLARTAFGVGRYLYNLPKPWVDYDQGRRQIKDPAGAARLIYEQAGLPIK